MKRKLDTLGEPDFQKLMILPFLVLGTLTSAIHITSLNGFFIPKGVIELIYAIIGSGLVWMAGRWFERHNGWGDGL